jgi:hypothetical protein
MQPGIGALGRAQVDPPGDLFERERQQIRR